MYLDRLFTCRIDAKQGPLTVIVERDGDMLSFRYLSDGSRHHVKRAVEPVDTYMEEIIQVIDKYPERIRAECERRAPAMW